MNEYAHKFIAEKGFELLPYQIKKQWNNGKYFIIKTCMYPDIFADKGLSIKEKKKIDPDFDNIYLEPEPPKDAWYIKLLKKLDKTPKSVICGGIPEKWIYLFYYYLKKTIDCLKNQDKDKAAKFAGVFSHCIGDLLQPIHLISPEIIDLLIKCPEEFISFELHSGIESITGKPMVKKYSPEILGSNIQQAVMGIYRKISFSIEQSRFTLLPMVNAIYSYNQKKAEKIAEISVKLATYLFCDFLRTCWAIAYEKIPSKPIFLTDYPYIYSTIDMLYRYKPMKNISLIPYSSGKFYPLTLLDKGQKHMKVKGFGVIPFLGPKKSVEKKIKQRDAKVEFLLWPGAYRKFTSIVGLNPLFKQSKGKVIFRVFVNQRILWKSKILTPQDSFIEVDINLPKSAHFLTLSMLTIEEPPIPVVNTHPHGVWAYPKLE